MAVRILSTLFLAKPFVTAPPGAERMSVHNSHNSPGVKILGEKLQEVSQTQSKHNWHLLHYM